MWKQFYKSKSYSAENLLHRHRQKYQHPRWHSWEAWWLDMGLTDGERYLQITQCGQTCYECSSLGSYKRIFQSSWTDPSRQEPVAKRTFQVCVLSTGPSDIFDLYSSFVRSYYANSTWLQNARMSVWSTLQLCSEYIHCVYKWFSLVPWEIFWK